MFCGLKRKIFEEGVGFEPTKKKNLFVVCFPGFDLPRLGDYVARFSRIQAGTLLPPKTTKRAGVRYLLVLGDSCHTRMTYAPEERTFVGKIKGGAVTAAEYGHMDVNYFFNTAGVVVFHFAVAGMRFACPGSWSIMEVNSSLSIATGCI